MRQNGTMGAFFGATLFLCLQAGIALYGGHLVDGLFNRLHSISPSRVMLDQIARRG